jgi:hypothetical protein
MEELDMQLTTVHSPRTHQLALRPGLVVARDGTTWLGPVAEEHYTAANRS